MSAYIVYNNFLRKAIFLFMLHLTIIAFSQTAWPGSQKDMDILLMFYNKKDIVVTPTRFPKPISKVAENITVITAKDIDEMNAHTIAEVLERVPGLFVSFNRDFGATSLMLIQGSDQRHVRVQVDGVPWNLLSEGAAETNSIPTGIIQRIEVVKGPASSAWGSALGGIINIITKPAGTTKTPSGTLSMTYGERNTQDYRAQAFGKAGALGYYLYAGHQDSNGLCSSRYFENNSLYAKFNVSILNNTVIGLNLGYSRPQTGLGDLSNLDLSTRVSDRTFFATSYLDAPLTEQLSLHMSLYAFKQKGKQNNDSLGLRFFTKPGELLLDNIVDEKTLGGSAKLIWNQSIHTAVLGVEFYRGDLDQTINAGKILRVRGVPASDRLHPDDEQLAVYANDTIVVSRWSFTPGIRYDKNHTTGSFTSPSMGVTYNFGEETTLRALVARGFTNPPLSAISGGGLFTDPNRSLKPESVWSYQMGIETRALMGLWLKATIFKHDQKKSLARERVSRGPPFSNYRIINKSKIRRTGIEVSANTIAVHNFSFLGGFSYVHLDPTLESGISNLYSYSIGIRYDDKNSINALLSGNYTWWNVDSSYEASYNDFIWDFFLTKKICPAGKVSSEIFFAVHNIFNGSQYNDVNLKNPNRWVEAGIRLSF